MKELVVLSGKGGTGKTSLTAAFATLAENCLLCDADVDAADLHLLMQPDVHQRTDFTGGGVAVIDPQRCTGCGTCVSLCRWSAIGPDYTVDEIGCEGCGVCVDFCPEQAIDFPVKICGQWFVSETRFGPMVHARLGIAEENSGKLVTLVRQQAGQLAQKKSIELIITDGPFTEAKEVIGGYAIFDAKSKAHMLKWTERFMNLHKVHMPGWEGECEVRQIPEMGQEPCGQNSESRVAAE